jgi:DNA-binding response OmpR family regulator
MKILIAEDNLVQQVILKNALEKEGFSVDCAVDGEQAYAALKQDKAPQLAVLDWMMPKINGLQLCQRLRREHDTSLLYLILLTARDQQDDLVMGLDAGADDFVVKPFRFEELHARIKVGKRVLEMQRKIKDYNKMQGVLEMAGAVCHEMNQPLQIVLSNSELLLQEDQDDPDGKKMIYVDNIRKAIVRLGIITRKIMTISDYKSKSHLGGKIRIIDLDNCSRDI